MLKHKKSISSTFGLLFVILCFGFQCHSLRAQFINHKAEQAFTNQPFFNASTIERYNIKSISGNFIHYKLGDRLRETDYFRKYIFNKKGQLIEQQEYTLLNYKNDTSVKTYKYDEQGNQIQFIHKDRNGSYGYFYEYDDEHRLVHLEYRRNYGKHKTDVNYKLGPESIVYAEKSTYKRYPQQLQQTIYNTNNIPYKDILIYYNEDSVVVKKTERLRRTRQTKTTTYTYNEMDFVDTIKVTSNREGVQDRMFIFSYDDNGGLSKKEEYKNGELITQYGVLYDDESLIIDDFLIQDVATNFIRDLHLDNYQYFDR